MIAIEGWEKAGCTFQCVSLGRFEETAMITLFVLNAPIMPMVSELAHLSSLSPKVVYWANGSVDPVGLRYWSARAAKVVVEDSIGEEVRKSLDGDPMLLSEFGIGMGARIRSRLAELAVSHGITRQGVNKASRPVLFFPTNDTIAKMFLPVSKRLDQCFYATPVRWREEGAAALLSSLSVPYMENHADLIDEITPSVIVFGNDWSGEEIEVMAKARRRGIPTVCIQEGCLDWGDSYRRMEWSDFPFVQGPLTLQYLHRDSCFLTGNPRFDDVRRVPLPEPPTVMINCNFTYDIHEDARDQWIKDVVAACKTLGLDFFISQHPRDKAFLPGLPVRGSNATVVHQQIAECSLLITRFSTLVYEAMLMGRPVIYYNPHGERMATFNEDSSGGLYKVHESAMLPTAIHSALDRVELEEPLRETFLNLHCGSHDHLAAKRCAEALEVVSRAGVVASDAARQRRSILMPAKRQLRKVANAILGHHSHA